MNAKLIFFISFILLIISPKNNIKLKPREYSFSKPKNSSYSKAVSDFYYATQTGIKTALSKKTKDAFRKFGLLHLMTPSGIHLSSILLFIFIFLKRKRRIWIYLVLLFFSIPLMGFYSLKRIIYFHLFNSFLKNNQLSFILTFILDLLIGGYLSSPLSFTFSFLCWGVIIFSPNKLSLIINLFSTQMMIAYFFNQEVNPLSFFINPIMTSIFSFFFPVMAFNFWFPFISILNDFVFYFIDLFTSVLISINSLFNFLAFIPSFSLIVILTVGIRKIPKPILLIFLMLNTIGLPKQARNTSSFKDQKVIIGFPHKRELLKQKNRKLSFLDRICYQKLEESFWRISCKKKALQYGGPKL